MALDQDEIAERLNGPGLTREQFDLLFSLLLEQEWGATDVAVDPRGGFSFLLPEETERDIVFTENVWIMAQQGVEPVYEAVQGFLRKAMARSGEEATAGQIVPLVRSSEYLELIEDANSQLLKEHLAGDLWIVYAVDLPETTITLSDDEREGLGVPLKHIPRVATANLSGLVPTVDCHGDGPCFELTADGCYEASLLLLDSIWDALAARVEGDVVAAVPTRDVLLFTGSASREGIATVRKATDRLFATGHHSVSKMLLRRRDERWVVF